MQSVLCLECLRMPSRYHKSAMPRKGLHPIPPVCRPRAHDSINRTTYTVVHARLPFIFIGIALLFGHVPHGLLWMNIVNDYTPPAPTTTAIIVNWEELNWAIRHLSRVCTKYFKRKTLRLNHDLIEYYPFLSLLKWQAINLSPFASLLMIEMSHTSEIAQMLLTLFVRHKNLIIISN